MQIQNGSMAKKRNQCENVYSIELLIIFLLNHVNDKIYIGVLDYYYQLTHRYNVSLL